MDARRIDSVWVSSDDARILEVAELTGARSLTRPAALSGDAASSESCWLHAIDEIDRLAVQPVDVLVAAQCTSPVRLAKDFDDAIESFEVGGCDSLFSATSVPDFNIWRPTAEGRLESFTYDYSQRGRRQEKGEQYLENGSFWILKSAVLRTYGNRLGGKIGIYPMDFWKSFQIDDPDDIRFCGTLMREYVLPEQL